MSRHGYIDDMEDALALGRWRAAVNSAINGKRGQAFLREMLAALDALPEKKLIEKELEEDGQVCALGAVAKARALDMSQIEAYDSDSIHSHFGIANAMAREIIYVNDEVSGEHVEAQGPTRWRGSGRLWAYIKPTPEKRFAEVRAWVVAHLKDEPR